MCGRQARVRNVHEPSEEPIRGCWKTSTLYEFCYMEKGYGDVVVVSLGSPWKWLRARRRALVLSLGVPDMDGTRVRAALRQWPYSDVGPSCLKSSQSASRGCCVPLESVALTHGAAFHLAWLTDGSYPGRMDALV